jgi:hypothetical protein
MRGRYDEDYCLFRFIYLCSESSHKKCPPFQIWPGNDLLNAVPQYFELK